MDQPWLFAEVPAADRPSAPRTRPDQARVNRPVRNQAEMMIRDLDSLLAEDHPARAIWAFVERLDLSAFYGAIKAVMDRPGRPASDPPVLLALWVYATVKGVGSARKLDRLCHEHDAYRWLRGGVPVNYHLLADFRVAQQTAMDAVLTEIVAAMLAEGLVSLERVAHDGLRVRARAGAASFRRAPSLERCREAAREQVERLAQEREHPDPAVSRRQQAARERAAAERLARVEEALRHLPAVQAAKEQQQRKRSKAERPKVTEPRVSTTDPEARVMRMGDGGFRPAFNVQLATDTAHGVIVGVGVTNVGMDAGQAGPMVRQVVQRTGRPPGAYLADSGFTDFADLIALDQQGVTVSMPPRPPRTTTSGRTVSTPRSTDPPEIAAWRARMGTEAAKTIYRERAATAEWVNAQARGCHGLQQFRVCGLAKVLNSLLLLAIAHNLGRWIALTT